MIQIEYRPAHQARIAALVDEIGRTDDRFLTDVQRMLVDGNTRDRLRGVDRTGRPLIPHGPRRGKYAGLRGPTLAPHGTASRAVKSFYADRRGNTIVAGFRGPGVEILAYHAAGRAGTGKRGQHGSIGQLTHRRFDGKRIVKDAVTGETKQNVTGIVRDVLGVSPQTVEEIRNEWKYTIRARFARGVRGVRRAAANFLGSF